MELVRIKFCFNWRGGRDYINKSAFWDSLDLYYLGG
jgi:hypothetical protein